MRAIFLFPSTERSVGRYFTHVRLWEKHCGSAQVCAFQRESEDEYLDRVDHVLGHIEHGNLLSRVPIYKAAIQKLSELTAYNDVIVVYTLDNFLLAWMAKVSAKSDIKIVLFMLDIRKLFVGNRLKNHIIQSFLLFAFERCALVLVSSRHYMEGYVAEYVRKLPPVWLEVENKVNPDELPKNLHRDCKVRDHDDQIVIGYFGILRCERSLQVLLEAAARANGRLKVIVRGEYLGVEHMIEQVEKARWLEFKGSYNNPDDLPEIYADCDVVWACYPYEAGAGNQQWAKTNRFYESGFFSKPAITSAGTRDAEFIAAEGNGQVVDLSDVETTVQSLIDLQQSDVQRWKRALEALPIRNFVYSDEFEKVANALKGNKKQ